MFQAASSLRQEANTENVWRELKHPPGCQKKLAAIFAGLFQQKKEELFAFLVKHHEYLATSKQLVTTYGSEVICIIHHKTQVI